MIRTLTIQNFAIIDHQRVTFSGGYTAITGETGAGKSILLKALGLALGARANTDVVRNGEREAVVEAEFALTEAQLADLLPRLEELGLADGERFVVRRIIGSSGRSRLYINDYAARLSVLSELTEGLADVIGQHASHDLLETERHIKMLDTFSGCTAEARRVASQVTRLRALQREALRLRASAEARKARAKQLRAQLSDIDAANLSPGEDERIAQQLDKLQNAEQIQTTTHSAFYMLSEANDSVLDVLAQVVNQLHRISHVDEELGRMAEVISSAQIELQEVARDVGRYSEGVYVSPEDLQELSERQSLIEDLKREHGGADRSVENVLLAITAMQDELDGLAWDDNRVREAAREATELEQEVMAAAHALSLRRQEGAGRLAALVESELAQLGMPSCRFRVQLTWRTGETVVDTVDAATSDSLTAGGLDAVEFLLSPNPGEGFKPLARTASGGELSRTTLALKGALIQTDPVGTYIFDEVDTGIGGGVAETVGRKLQTVGETRQVICITHLAQVCSCAHQHLKVRKAVVGADRTVSEVRTLSRDQRIEEIARMLGGAELTSKTIAHAEEMLERARSASRRDVSAAPPPSHAGHDGELPLVWGGPPAVG